MKDIAAYILARLKNQSRETVLSYHKNIRFSDCINGFSEV